MNGGWASALRWDGAKGKLAYSAAHLRRGAGESQRPLWLFSRSAGCEHRVSSHRQDQHFPSPRLRMLPRKVLPWSLQGSLELAVGTGAPVHPQGAPAAQGAACTHGNTSLLLENFSQAVTHSSMVSTRISSGMSEC